MVDVHLRPGAVIDDRFTLRRQLGSGGCGVVWLASDRAAEQSDVVLKILHSHFDRYSIGIRQLEREAELLAQLAHPNIAKPLIFSTKGSHTYLAMEFIDGRPLDQEIGAHSKSDAHFSYREVSRVFEEICSAVNHAHSRTIIHRDLKPQNIMIVRRGGIIFVKVLDFGIAKLIEGSLFDATTLGRRLGSMFYMSPEQCKGEPAGVRSDVFAMGVILYEILTLRRAWAWDLGGRPLKAFDAPVRADGANALAPVMLRVASAPRPRPSDVRPGLSQRFDDIVTRAMAIAPSDRFPSVDMLLVAFRRAAADLLVREKGTEIVDVREILHAGKPAVPSAATSDTRLDEVDREREALLAGSLEGSGEGVWRVGGQPSVHVPAQDTDATATMRRVTVDEDGASPGVEGEVELPKAHRSARAPSDTGPMKGAPSESDDPRETLELVSPRVRALQDTNATAIDEVVESDDFDTALRDRVDESALLAGATEVMESVDDPDEARRSGRPLESERTPVQPASHGFVSTLSPVLGALGGGASTTAPTQTVWRTVASILFRYRFLLLSVLGLLFAFLVGIVLARWTGVKERGGESPGAPLEQKETR